MSAQNFLTNQLGRIGKGLERVIAGDDYLDSKSTPGKNYDKFKKDKLKRQVRTPNGLSSLNKPGELVPRQSRLTPEIPKPLNPNASARSRARTPVIKPNQFAAQPTGRLTAAPMPTARGGILTGLAGIAANQLVDPIVREAVAGARVLSNDPYAHTPVNIKSLNGANYDISTEAGRSGYDKAKRSGGLSDMDQRALRLKNDERIAKIKAESDAVIKAGQDDINSVFYKTPTRDTPAPNGGSGSGTQTSLGGKPILDAAGAQAFYQSVGLGGFLSTQLPGTGANPDTKGTIEAVPFGGQETSITTNTLGAFSDTDGNAFINLNPKFNPEYFTNPNPELMKAIGSTFNQYGELAQGNGAPTTATQGSKSYKEIRPTDPIAVEAFGQDWVDSNKGKGGSSRLNEALNDTASMQAPMTEERRRLMANAAFLSTEGPGSTLLGLRAKEAVLGQIHAGGQTYQLNEDRTELIQDKNGKPIAADRDAASAFRQGTMGAEAYRESFKDAVKKVAAGNDGPITPKAGENPFAQMPAPATTAFPTDIPAETFAPASTEIGEMMDTVRGMDMTPPISSQQINDSFLNKREPLMRDPRKK